ncbi:amidase family protein [Bordetella pertussis]|uniref:amidase family protein n=1 Tax=Bordetella pertussis TaxID=520 RepID=UPI003C6D2A73
MGGSSSGSAVAVAAGLCYGSLGTDTAGSVSIPAATCGVVGLMPTRGLLPGDGVAPLAGELDTVGLLARCADDAQAVLHAALDAAQAAALDAAATPAMERWRIATCWIHPDPAVRLDPAVHAALEDYATECSARGRRREARLAALPQWIRLAQTLLYAGSAAAHAQALRGQAPAPVSYTHLTLPTERIV